MDDIGPGVTEHFGHVRVIAGDVETVGELARHERLLIADPDDLSVADPADLGQVLVGDHAAADESDLHEEKAEKLKGGN